MIEIQNHPWPVAPRIPIYLAALSGSLFLIYSIFWIDVTRLSDYENYLQYAIDFQEKSWGELGLVELFSFAQIKFFGSLGNEVSIGLQKLYVLNAIIAAIGLFGLSVKYAQTFSGVFLVYVLYGPIMSYVTLRATPAYILVAWFVLMEQGAFRKFILMLIAAFYHVTAVVPAVLVAGVSFLKLGVWLNPDNKNVNSSIFVISIFFLGICIELMWMLGFGDIIVRLVLELTTGAGKFQEYLESASMYRTPAHFGYFVFVLLATCFYLYLTSGFVDNLWWVIVLALVSFIFLSISPVVAYRFSIFFLLPVFLIFPKTKNPQEHFLNYSIIFTGSIIGIVQSLKLFTD